MMHRKPLIQLKKSSLRNFYNKQANFFRI